jgi:hypothetical protein
MIREYDSINLRLGSDSDIFKQYRRRISYKNWNRLRMLNDNETFFGIKPELGF